MTDLTTKVEMIGGYNWRRDKPAENYGIHGVNIIFSVHGPVGGAVSLLLYTNWFPLDCPNPIPPLGPYFADLSYHSRTCINKLDFYSADCKFNQGPCYSDGSGLRAAEFLPGFLHGGTDWLFPKLKEYYRYIYQNKPYPDLTPSPRPYPQKESFK